MSTVAENLSLPTQVVVPAVVQAAPSAEPITAPPTAPLPASRSVQLPRWPVHHRFSVAQYHQMIDRNILSENDRVELIRGEVVEKMVIGKPHNAMVIRLTRILGRQVGELAMISVQGPVTFIESEPEPDLCVLQLREDCYEDHKPRPDETYLIIEVADTTLEYDRSVKQAIYAEAGIAEYWIVNLRDDCVEVYRQPQASRVYGSMQMVRRGEQIQMVALPALSIPVADILP